MSVEVMSARSTRRLARQIGDPTITRAWVNNSFNHMIVQFATWDHIHGWYDRRSGESWQSSDSIRRGPHLPSCYDADGALLLNLEPFDDDGRWPVL